jgi:hypothetical protein
MHEVLRLLHGWKSFESLALVTQNDVPDLKIPATKKDPLVLKKKVPPPYFGSTYAPLSLFKKTGFAILLRNFQETHLCFVTSGAFIVLGHIHQIEALIRSKSYRDVPPFACQIRVRNLGLG